MSEQAQMFMDNMQDQIDRGVYDKEITMPFMSRKLILASFKARIDQKLETGGTPLLTDAEIKDGVNDAKETAAQIYRLFLNVGILEKDEDEVTVEPKIKKYLINPSI